MERRFRLTRSTDFKRVRSSGKSFAHPLLVLVVTPLSEQTTRIGVTASRGIGGAVSRNRAKRLMREVFREAYKAIQPGWDLIAIARVPILTADFTEIEKAVSVLLKRARLLLNANE